MTAGDAARPEVAWPVEGLHAAIIAASQDPIYFCTPDYIIREANDPYVSIGGLTREEAIGRTVQEVAGPGAFPRRAPYLETALAGRVAVLQDWVTVPGQGRRFFDVRYQPVHDGQGRLLGVAAYGRDITDLKKAEEVLRLYESAVTQMSDRLSVVDRDYRYILTNESNARWHGCTAESFRGRSLVEVVGEERFASEIRPWLDRCLAGETVEYDFHDMAPDGARVVMDARLQPFRNGDGEIEAAVVTLRDVTETRRLSERLERLALQDDLTGIANRRSFETGLERRVAAYRKGGSKGFSVVFIDLDGFKLVNDTAGHGAGDRFLQDIARLLRQSAGEGVEVARIGGDEFGLIIDTGEPVAAHAICSRLLSAFEGYRLSWEDMQFRSSASIGIASVAADDAGARQAITVGRVLQWADFACMQAKAAGGHRIVAHDGAEKTGDDRKAEIHHLLAVERAIAGDGFLLHSMTVIDLATGKPVMREVLPRVASGTGDLHGPSMIRATAERHGLMRAVDRLVINAVLARLEAGETDGLPVAVDLSAETLHSQVFAGQLIDRLERAPDLPRSLVFEVSESALSRMKPEAWNLMADLRGLGCRIALDHFGRGVAGFTQLRANAFDFIKIDRLLTAGLAGDPVKRAAVSGVVGLAEALGLPTVAEYVTEPLHLDILKGLGVTYAQGHAVSRPQAWC
ncbi:putative bifunctional diguanylate cyclase/phosphodiesterase [Stappia indica]|uniref:PAS domain S-box-containing protein/diguanylate cyclase (GGDEF) domain-containing protein n=1 Tax=Stappia indica TaxID=538381 RepID=A0A285S1M2_9HYPH|nr:GGDEF and EAL domain-containing protein [Stappia indica]SOC00811.1 PAS domain S-box-containing protein/diguanylate cyclase (GGDEF) domain-containing protein [Stappia indica]